MNKKFITQSEAIELLKSKGKNFVVVQNPAYVFPSFELYPLAPPTPLPIKKLAAVVMDMDGTTTSTEEICIHSLEFMIRKITGRNDKNSWKGLDHQKDYPHIIGNSTTKHVEYLIKTYQNEIKRKELSKSYIYAVLWTLLIGKDKSRKAEVLNNLYSLKCDFILRDKKFPLNLSNDFTEEDLLVLVSYFENKILKAIKVDSLNSMVRVGTDIYYQRYHKLLSDIASGNAKTIKAELQIDKNKNVISPLPGIALFLALIKGLLGKEIAKLTDDFILQFYEKDISTKEVFNKKFVMNRLFTLSNYFEKNPVKVAVVTSSIFYEANIVLTEVFSVLQKEVYTWKISEKRKHKIINAFSSYKKFYDGFVTASDSNEIRLKPHRDLYSIALHQLAIPKKDFDKVIGFEDSESGTTAIRAAGIGICVAVPFAQTSGHDFTAATHIAKNGVMEVVLKHNLFIK